MEHINSGNNFCRVYRLPDSYPLEYCFGGGHQVTFTMVDWFNPIPQEDMAEYGGTIKSWDHYKEGLNDFLKKKHYVIQGKKYLLITEFGESFIFNKE